MALQSSGPISLLDIANEFGGTAPHSLSEYYGAGGVVASGAISLSLFYGLSNVPPSFEFSITSNVQEGTLSTLALNAGWDGSSPIIATIASNIWLFSDNTSVAGLTVNVANSTIVNNGRIIGKGGKGGNGNLATGEFTGGNGGPAISVTAGGVTIINNSGAFIAGGGGGGGAISVTGGGGGAGGGVGGFSYGRRTSAPFTGFIPPGQKSTDVGDFNSYSGTAGGAGGRYYRVGISTSQGEVAGGAGGRILPGSTTDSFATSSLMSAHFNPSSGRGGAQGPGGNAQAVSGVNSSGTSSVAQVGGGGGGWGAAGGSGNTSAGAGGAAISKAFSISLTNNGTIYGAT